MKNYNITNKFTGFVGVVEASSVKNAITKFTNDARSNGDWSFKTKDLRASVMDDDNTPTVEAVDNTPKVEVVQGRKGRKPRDVDSLSPAYRLRKERMENGTYNTGSRRGRPAKPDNEVTENTLKWRKYKEKKIAEGRANLTNNTF